MRLVFVLFSFLWVATAALADQRHALVIGIDNYDNVPSLKKAINDAEAVAAALDGLEFNVTSVIDADRRAFIRAVSKVAAAIQPGDEIVFFFAGHGVEVAGRNYLLPADVPDAVPGDEDYVIGESVAVDAILDMFQRRDARVSVLILDACRDNPFERDGTRSLGSQRGLARVDPPKGAFVLFSAGSGERALDRLSNNDPNPNSVFTRSLLPRLSKPGLTIRDLVMEVRLEVEELAKSVRHTQFPAYYDQMSGTFAFNPKSVVIDPDLDPEVLYASLVRNEDWDGLEEFAKRFPDHPRSANARATLSMISDRQFWRHARDADTREAYATYIAAFPNGLFIEEARKRMGDRRPQTEEVLSFAIFRNADVYGGDLTKDGIRGINQQQCQDLCAGNSASVAYSYVADERQWCWPKSSLGERSAKPGIISGIKQFGGAEVASNPVIVPQIPQPPVAEPSYQVQRSVDYPGGDIDGQDRRGISLNQCQDHCSRLTGCTAFSYVPRLRWCWPKHSIVQVAPDGDVISGFNPKLARLPGTRSATRSFTTFSNTDFLGRDLTEKGHRGVSLAGCEAICASDDRCQGYSYVHAKNWCWPKYGIGAISRSSGTTSGQKN